MEKENGGAFRRKSIPTVNAVAKFLSESEILLENWSLLDDELGVNNPDKLLLAQSLKTGQIKSYELFKKIVKLWKEKEGKEASIGSLANALLRMDLKGPTEELVDRFDNIPIQSNNLQKTLSSEVEFADHQPLPLFHSHPEWFGVAHPTTNFHGRDEEILRIKDSLTSALNNNSGKCITITGAEGIGKTELLRKLAAWFFNDGNISGSVLGFSEESLGKVFTLAGKLGFPKQNGIDAVSVFIKVVKFLRRSTPVLITIDVGQESQGIIKLAQELLKAMLQIEPGKNVPVILIASQNSSIFEPWSKDSVGLKTFTKEEIQGFAKSIATQIPESCLNGILKISGGVPTEFLKCVSVFQRYGEAVQGRKATPMMEAVICVLTYCHQTLNATYGYKLVSHLISPCPLPSYVAAVKALSDANLVTLVDADRGCHISEHTQSILRLILFAKFHIGSDNDFNEQAFLKKLLSFIGEIWRATSYSDALHFGAIWSHGMKYDELVVEFHTVPGRFLDESKPKKVLDFQFLQDNYKRLREVLGFEHQSTLKLGLDLAHCKYYLGDTEGALDLFTCIFEEYKTKHPKDHVAICSGEWKAWVLMELKRYKELKIVHEELKELCNNFIFSYEEK